MHKALIVSLDLIRSGEPQVPLSTASLLAALRADPEYGDTFTVEHCGINLLHTAQEEEQSVVLQTVLRREPRSFDTIAIACYVWSERVVRGLLKELRRLGFDKQIVLGGPQISYASPEGLPEMYPEADVFVSGYAETALRTAIRNAGKHGSKVLTEAVDFNTLPSPYLSGSIDVEQGQERVRMETRRGCPYRCSFCAHRDVRNGVQSHSESRVQAEIEWLHARQVRKVNFLDPVFNMGREYLPLMQHMVDTRFSAAVTFQSRFELVRNEEGERFIDLAGKLDATLEFGLQTAVESEGKAVNRRNRHADIERAMRALNEAEVPYEVSLIYGLPGQTVQSFTESILFLQANGCRSIVAFPLMLLRGTELFAERARWGFKERPEGRFGIPVVYESNSFSEADFGTMRQLADELSPHERV